MIDIEEMFSGISFKISDIKPSVWYEQNMVMPLGSAFPGPFRYNKTPYWREIVDCFDKNHPAREISLMAHAQGGKTVGVINALIGYTISQNPGNIMLLTGHSDLTKAAVLKIDAMIDGCGIRHLIKPTILRPKNNRSGDTDTTKEFVGGDFKSGSVTNHNLLRQHDVMIMIVDDYDAAPASSKAAGSTRQLVQKRTSAFGNKKKIAWVSSPQLKGKSNIETVFLKGDQRYFMVPCPCCGEFINLKWEVDIDESNKAGITWKVDAAGHPIKSSIGYICQKCSGFFTDQKKDERNNNGFWKPTVIPVEEYHYSYSINALYSPAGMDDWAFYVQQYMDANPLGAARKEKEHQTFINVVCGEPYEETGEEISANELQMNIRNYPIGQIPESISLRDGNGKIVLLTCAVDLNGTVYDQTKGTIDDVRVDYEICAWAENGSSYSISHGSIGTFIPLENSMKIKQDRERWTYHHGKSNSVWPVLDEILGKAYEVDTGRKMQIMITGLDTGHFTNFAYHYVDNSNFFIVGLKGDKENAFLKYGVDVPNFKIGRERANLYLVQVNKVKDELSHCIGLKWNKNQDDIQPNGFMNFPLPSEGKYLLSNYFSHYASEQRLVEENKEGFSIRWKRKPGTQNHFFDCRVYNFVLKEIFVHLFFKEAKVKNATWTDYCKVILGGQI